MTISEEEIRKVIEKYEYGQFNILKNPIRIQYGPEKKRLLLKNFRQHDKYPTVGSCSELECTAYRTIRERFPSYFAIRAHGNDLEFFPSPVQHNFLLLANEDIMGDTRFTFDQDRIAEILKHDPLIVDPSLRYVGKLSLSRYKITCLQTQGCKVAYFNSVILDEGGGIPLAFTQTREVMSLFFDPNLNCLLSIWFSKNSEFVEGFKLDSVELEQKLKDEKRLLDLVKFIQHRGIMQTNLGFSEDKVVMG